MVIIWSVTALFAALQGIFSFFTAILPPVRRKLRFTHCTILDGLTKLSGILTKAHRIIWYLYDKMDGLEICVSSLSCMHIVDNLSIPSPIVITNNLMPSSTSWPKTYRHSLIRTDITHIRFYYFCPDLSNIGAWWYLNLTSYVN